MSDPPKSRGDRLRELVDGSRAVRAVLGVILAAIAGGAVLTASVTLDSDEAGHPHPHGSVTVTLGGPGQAKVELPPAAQAQATVQAREDAAGDDQAAHSDLRDATPPAPELAEANAERAPPGQAAIPANPPLAAQNVPGCKTLLVRNYSSRAGAPILLFVLHYTVSTDNGWSGVLGNVKWFDTAAASASSNFIIDRKLGACALTVAEQSKAWTQAGFNPWSLSVEVTATGRESSLVEGAGRARLIALMRRAHDVYKLPFRQAIVSGCKVIRSGFIRHKDLGACGGGHVDTTPWTIDDLIAEAAQASSSSTSSSSAKLTAGELEHIKTLELERRVAKRHGGWAKVDASHLRNATRAKDWLRARVKTLEAAKPTAGRKARIGRIADVIAG